VAAKKGSAPRKVESIRHKDKRTNIPTEELRDFVVEEELAPKTLSPTQAKPKPTIKQTPTTQPARLAIQSRGRCLLLR